MEAESMFAVEVVRTSYQHATFSVLAASQEEAEQTALAAACDHGFGTATSAEYSVVGVEPVRHAPWPQRERPIS